VLASLSEWFGLEKIHLGLVLDGANLAEPVMTGSRSHTATVDRCHVLLLGRKNLKKVNLSKVNMFSSKEKEIIYVLVSSYAFPISFNRKLADPERSFCSASDPDLGSWK
jgi:hypothetical protein